MNVGPISDPRIHIKPSKALRKFIAGLKASSDIPQGVADIFYKNKTTATATTDKRETPYLCSQADLDFIEQLKLDEEKLVESKTLPGDEGPQGEKLLNLQELHWLHAYIVRKNEESSAKMYLHELLEGSEIVMPKNRETPRNPELEKRCEKLRASQQNREYKNMTKNVDSTRKNHPEDTISYQMKQMNRHLIAVFQFVVSVLAGFAFGFIGIELFTGSLDFGFRLLLGIMCALIIALAELYFLAKKLNEDLRFEMEQAKGDGKRYKLD